MTKIPIMSSKQNTGSWLELHEQFSHQQRCNKYLQSHQLAQECEDCCVPKLRSSCCQITTSGSVFVSFLKSGSGTGACLTGAWIRRRLSDIRLPLWLFLHNVPQVIHIKTKWKHFSCMKMSLCLYGEHKFSVCHVVSHKLNTDLAFFWHAVSVRFLAHRRRCVSYL